MENQAIEIEALSKSYGEIKAVRGLSLSVGRAEMFALVGPDGAGKTTTIRTLCGILKPDSGKARVLGFDLSTELDQIKRRIGYLSQRFSLYGDLTVDENIEFFADIHGVRDYSERRNELLAFTRLEPFRGRLAERLSGGMKQKLALACTLIHRPDIIFLDEPTTGVDPVSRREFWIILSDLLRSGLTIVMSTPYLDEAERATRVGLMDGGELLMADRPSVLKATMTGISFEVVCPEVRKAGALLRASKVLRDVQLFGDRLTVAADETAGGEAEIRSLLGAGGLVPEALRVVPVSLENVFISLMKMRKGGAS
jgi:ABC-2 type transport system ATP-binding protein